jgi:hypothetical protein
VTFLRSEKRQVDVSQGRKSDSATAEPTEAGSQKFMKEIYRDKIVTRSCSAAS